MEHLKVLLTEEKIKKKVIELAGKIERDYAGQDLLVVGLLKGAFIFVSDLVRALNFPVKIDFMAVSSYGISTESLGVVRILKDLDETIEGKHVLVVDDIIDTGLTLKYLVKNLQERNPASIKICTLLDKPARRKVELKPDYVGFKISDYFVVGYGLDCAEKYRNFPEVRLFNEAAERAKVENKG